MNVKTFLALVLVTGLAVFAFYKLSLESEASSGEAGPPARLFPDFGASIERVAALHVEGQDGSFTLRRSDDGWGMKEKHGYPVDAAKVRDVLYGIKDAAPIEAMTKSPELHHKLGLQDPDAEDASSTRVTALAEDGTEIASLVIGDRRTSKGSARRLPGTSTQMWYVRKASEPQSWLVEAGLDVDSTERGWLAKEILDIERDRIQSVSMVRADGESYEVRKESPEDASFTLSPMPEGRELAYASAPGSLAGGLARLTLDDVLPADEVELDDPPLAVATFKTFEGLSVTVTTTERDEKLYAKFDVSYEEVEPDLMGPPPVEAPDEPEGLEDETTGAEDAADSLAEGEEEDAEEDEGPTPEDLQAEAQEIAARTSGWVYVLPSWKKSTLAKPLEDMLKDLPEEEPAEEAGAPESGADEVAPPSTDELAVPIAGDEEPATEEGDGGQPDEGAGAPEEGSEEPAGEDTDGEEKPAAEEGPGGDTPVDDQASGGDEATGGDDAGGEDEASGDGDVPVDGEASGGDDASGDEGAKGDGGEAAGDSGPNAPIDRAPAAGAGAGR